MSTTDINPISDVNWYRQISQKTIGWKTVVDEINNSSIIASIRQALERHQLQGLLKDKLRELYASESRFQNVIAKLADSIVIIDSSGIVNLVNPAATTLFNCQPEELIGQEFFGKLVKERVACEIETGIIAKKGEATTSDIRVVQTQVEVMRLGAEKAIAEMRVVETEWDGNLAFIASLRDITARKAAEEKLRQTTSELTAIFQAFPDIFFQLDSQGIILDYQSGQLSEIYLSPTELINRTLTDVLPTEIKHQFAQAIAQVNESKSLVAIEYSLTLPTGIKHFEARLLPLLENQIMVIIRDITERKQAEVALRQSEAKFHKLVANVPGMIYQFLRQKDGTIAWPFISPICEEIYELTPAEIQANSHLLLEAIHPDDHHSFHRSLTTSAEKLQPWNWEGRIVTKSGKIKWIEGASRPELQANGDILWDGLIMDITERKRASDAIRESEFRFRTQAQKLETTLSQLKQTQTQLIQTEKMSSLGQLVAGVAHEINNPISFIYGNLAPASEYIEDLLNLVELYKQHYPAPNREVQDQIEAIDLDFIMEDLPKLVASMKLGADRIREIVLSLRNFSRLDEAEMKPVDIHDGIDSTLLILQNRLKAKPDHPGIKIRKEYGKLPQVECFAGQLNQVFMNILANGIDALESDPKLINSPTHVPEIKIQTEILENQVLIRFADNGPGMTEKVRKCLFDPFFTTKPVGKGTGLGLSISYQIVVEKHHGMIVCNSQVGQGTEFVITIPLIRDRQ